LHPLVFKSIKPSIKAQIEEPYDEQEEAGNEDKEDPEFILLRDGQMQIIADDYAK
jgi:hypothetical protein